MSGYEDRAPTPATREQLREDLERLGVGVGEVLMIHASMKAIGPVSGGPATLVQALLDVVGPRGTLMSFGSWDRSPYEETLNGARMDPLARATWPAFDPARANTYRGFGILNAYLRAVPGARRSAHPDASMIAVGARSQALTENHQLGNAYGPGSPLERFVARNGRVLLLGAGLDALTVLHYAEAIADIPNKRRVTYEMPVMGPAGSTIWMACEDFDSNGILDCFALPHQMDAVEAIARDYVRARPYARGQVANAAACLFDAKDLVDFGRRWLECRFGCATVPAS